MKIKQVFTTIIICVFTAAKLFSQITNITSINVTACNNQTVSFVVSSPFQGSSYLWQDSTSSGWVNIINSNNFQGASDDTLVIVTNNANFVNKFFRCIVDSSSNSANYDTSDVFSLSILPALIKPVISKNQSICYNTSADTLRTIQLATGANNQFTYQWQASNNGINWINLGTINATNLNTGNLTSSSYFRLGARSDFGCGIVYSDSIFVNVATIFISPKIGDNQTICNNTSPSTIRIKTSASGGGGVYSYQWQVSSNNVDFINIPGATLDSLAVENLTQNRLYRLNTISNLGCGTLISDTVSINVYFALSRPDINLNNIQNNICYNSNPDTFRLIIKPSGGNNQFEYQWQQSNDGMVFEDISNANDSLYVTNALLNSVYFRVISTSKVGCGSVISDTIFVNVFPILQKPIINGNQSICFNTQADTLRTIQLATGANGLFSYQWESSNNGISWNIFGSANTLNLGPGSLIASKYYRLAALSNFGCGVVYSDSIYINVYSDLISPEIENNQTICYNTSPNTIKINIPAIGGGDLYSYQWQVSSNNINFSNLSGATLDSLPLGNLIANRFYRLNTTSNLGCGSVISDTVSIIVYKPLSRPDINLTNSSKNICYNSVPDTFMFNRKPSGGNNQFDYQWQLSNNGTDYLDIPYANDSFYIASSLINSVFFRVISISKAGCGSILSDSVFVNVYAALQEPKVISGSQSICFNTQADTLRTTQFASGGNGQFTYQWQSSTNGNTWDNVGKTNLLKLATGNLTGSTYYRLSATSNFGCGVVYSDSVYVNVYPILTSSTIGNNQTICYNTAPSSLKVNIPASGGGGLYSNQWQVSEDNLSYSNIIGASLDTLVVGNLNANKYYRLNITSNFGCGSTISNTISIVVYRPLESGSIVDNDSICYNQSTRNMALKIGPSGGDGTYSYRWLFSLDTLNWNFISDSNNDSLKINNLTSSTYFQLEVTSGSNCGVALTNKVYVHVFPLPDTSLIVGLAQVCKNQQRVNYKRSAKGSQDYSYEWYTDNGMIQSGKNLDSCFIHWGIISGIDSLKLKQTNIQTGCTNTMILPVLVKESYSPDLTHIKRKENSNILVCEDQQTGIIYQWGYINKQSGLHVDIPNANLQYVQLPFQFDTTIHIYYVKTSLGDCSTISYYNYEPLPLGLKESAALAVNIYPNPSAGSINLNCNERIENLSITDLQGKSIQYSYETKDIGIHSIKIDESVPSGLYFIRLMVKGEFINHKIILIK